MSLKVRRHRARGQDMIPDMADPDMAEPPIGCSWGRYLELLCQAHGGPTALVDLLIHRARGSVELPSDPQTIERGLRRLSRRANGSGGKYGRWLVRFFGVPKPLSETARWMGQYHSRFADLPTSLRHAQLALWDRPPMCETRDAAWIHLGFASVAMRRRDPREAAARLARARRIADDPEALIEADLLAARLASDAPDAHDAGRALNDAAARLQQLSDEVARLCYAARIADQRAYRWLHPEHGAPDLAAAERAYASIDGDAEVPFALFRRHHGLAYCAHKRGAKKRAAEHAQLAAEHAADAGLIRFRAMALKLHAHIVGGQRGETLRERAARMARMLEQEDLQG